MKNLNTKSQMEGNRPESSGVLFSDTIYIRYPTMHISYSNTMQYSSLWYGLARVTIMVYHLEPRNDETILSK